MYKVNADSVLRLITYNYGSVTDYCKSAGISRTIFYRIINKKHRSLKNISLQRLAAAVYLKPEEITTAIK